MVQAPGLIFFLRFFLSQKVLYFYNPSSITPSETPKPNTTVLWVMWNTTPGFCPIRACYLWNKTITNSLHHHKHPHKTFTPDEAMRSPLASQQSAENRRPATIGCFLSVASWLEAQVPVSIQRRPHPWQSKGDYFVVSVIRYDEKTYHKLRPAPLVLNTSRQRFSWAHCYKML